MNRYTKVLLVLVLEILLIAPAALNQRVDRGSKSLDEYWAETDLSSGELESLLDNKICYADRLSFLSCANSISVMAQKYDLYLTPQGELKKLTVADIAQRLSEKQEMTSWARVWDQQKDKLTKISGQLKFLEIWKTLDQKYIKHSRRASVIATGLNGYLSVAKDPHSYILPLAFYDEVIAQSESRQNQLGFIARRAGDRVIVRKIFEGSPAETAGLKKGDYITAVNGFAISSLLPSQFSDLLKLNNMDRLSLVIDRDEGINLGESNDNKKIKKYIEIIKTDYIAPSVASQVIEGPHRLGLLTLHKFAKNTCVEARQHLIGLLERGVSGILLDVRDNPGGQVDEASCILNLFIEKGKTLFETRFNKSSIPPEKYIAEKAAVYSGPLAVLINSGSASASEIVAGALKDLGRAALVGERSFGKGTFQDGHLWGNHNKIVVFETEGMYYFPSGWSPQLVGLEPDIRVQFARTELSHEQDLYYNPINPPRASKNAQTGLQSLAGLRMLQCQSAANMWENQTDNNWDDPQLEKAGEWLNCNGKIGSL